MPALVSSSPPVERHDVVDVDLPSFMQDLEKAVEERDLQLLRIHAQASPRVELLVSGADEVLDQAATLGGGVVYLRAICPGDDVDQCRDVVEKLRVVMSEPLPTEDPEATRKGVASLDRLAELLSTVGGAALAVGYLRGAVMHVATFTDGGSDLAAALVTAALMTQDEDDAEDENEDLAAMEPERAAEQILAFLDRAGVSPAERLRHPRETVEKAVNVMVDDWRALSKDGRRRIDEAMKIATRMLRTG